MKPIPFLARFKVSTKIGVGFAIVLLLLTAVGSFGGMALNDGVRLQTSYASISDNAQRVVRIAHLVAEMRRDVRVAIDENDFEAASPGKRSGNPALHHAGRGAEGHERPRTA